MATALRYRFLAFDPADFVRVSAVKEWTAKLRLKYQLHNWGDHYEVECLRAAQGQRHCHLLYHRWFIANQHRLGHLRWGIPRPGQLPHRLRVGRRRRLRFEFLETIRIAIPQKGTDRPPIDLAAPARWNQQTKLDDAGAVWDFLQRMELAVGVSAYDISLTAESTDGQQNVEYSGALEGGWCSCRR